MPHPGGHTGLGDGRMVAPSSVQCDISFPQNISEVMTAPSEHKVGRGPRGSRSRSWTDGWTDASGLCRAAPASIHVELARSLPRPCVSLCLAGPCRQRRPAYVSLPRPAWLPHLPGLCPTQKGPSPRRLGHRGWLERQTPLLLSCGSQCLSQSPGPVLSAQAGVPPANSPGVASSACPSFLVSVLTLAPSGAAPAGLVPSGALCGSHAQICPCHVLFSSLRHGS